MGKAKVEDDAEMDMFYQMNDDLAPRNFDADNDGGENTFNADN